MRNLSEKVVVITGAASGIGEALALGLAQRGASLALVDVQKEPLDALASNLGELGHRVSSHVADVGNRRRMEQLPEEILAHHGDIDVLINNAGVNVGGLFEDHGIEDAEWLLQVNLMGVIYGCKSFLPHLKSRPEAHIVNLSSMAALFGVPNQAIYSVSKAGIAAFTAALQSELASSRVRFTRVHPGTIKSNFLASSRMADADAKQSATSFQQKYGMATERAAEKIIRAIEKNKSRLLIGFDAHLVDLLTRLMPVGFQRIVSAVFARI